MNDLAVTPNQFHVLHVHPGGTTTVDIEPTRENIHHVQPLPGGRWLLVRARAASPGDANAHVYSPGGMRVSSFHAGDGIADVQVSAGGQIWVSYFDEGVFGARRVSLGASGLACLDEDGTPQFRYTDAPGGDDSLADCYAMNVASDRDVWLYYYTRFPLVHVRDRKVARRLDDIPVRGAHAFAVDRGAAVFGPGYGESAALTRLDLKTKATQAATAFIDGAPVKEGDWFGRQSRLYVYNGRALYGVDVAAFPMR